MEDLLDIWIFQVYIDTLGRLFNLMVAAANGTDYTLNQWKNE